MAKINDAPPEIFKADNLLQKILKEAEPAKDMLLERLRTLPRYESHLDAPSLPGVYVIWDGKRVVYAGSSGHGEKTGLRQRLYRVLKRTGLSPLRKGIARDIGHPEYQPKSRGPRNPEIEEKIDDRVSSLVFSYIEASDSKSARNLERLIISLLDPKYNKG
jgi:hypothetical protein